MAIRISPPQNKTYYINPSTLTFVENSGYGANLIQVSASSSCYISVFDPANGISYNDADRNYRRWKVTAHNNKFPNNAAFHIYVRLEREGNAALVVYSTVLLGVNGGEVTEEVDEEGNTVLVEGDPDPMYFFIKIGEVSETNGVSIREITYDTGYLESDEWTSAAGLDEMWELDKYSTPWLIRAKQWLQSFTVKGFVTLIGGLVFRKGDVEKAVTDVKRSTDSDEDVPISDDTVPTTKYVQAMTDERYLRKDKDDRSVGTISSDKGFEAGKFVQEATGAACWQDEDGNWHIETDHLRVRKKAVFTEIEVQEVHHVGGQMMLTSANMIVDYVYEMTDRYRCYFRKVDGDGREVENLWRTGDQAYCNTFNLTKQADGTLGNHYLWRLVVATNLDTSDDAAERTFGDVTIQTSEYNFTDLSKTECASLSDAPFATDEIVSLGYQPDDDPNRQNAIIIAGAGSGSPYIYEFTGINTFALPEPETRIKPGDNLFSGMMRIQGGSTGAKNLEDFPDEVFKAVHIGAVNLLLNSGFTGDYRSEDLTSSSGLTSESELFSKALKHWTGSATVSDDASAVSGRCAVIGSLSQSVQLMEGEHYVVSFQAKGSSVKVMLGGDSVEQALTSEYVRHAFKFVSDGVGTFSISGTATICDLQLERGTIATDWNPSPNDNDKTLAEFQALTYIQDAIVNGSTDILGGLILSSMMQLGNYKDGVMQKVNAGVSGIFNDDNDVAFWGGGTFEQAIRTIIRFKQNPQYNPTDSEWADLANFAVSHGGDVFMRGYIYALGGLFRGSVNIANGKILLDNDGSGHYANGNVYWDKNGVTFRNTAEIINWTSIEEYAENLLIDYSKGTYIDLTYILSDDKFILKEPVVNGYTIALTYRAASRSQSPAILQGSFYVMDGEEYTEVEYLTIYSLNTTHLLEYDVEMNGWRYFGSDVMITDEGIAIIGGNPEGINQIIEFVDNEGNSHNLTFTNGILTAYT